MILSMHTSYLFSWDTSLVHYKNWAQFLAVPPRSLSLVQKDPALLIYCTLSFIYSEENKEKKSNR